MTKTRSKRCPECNRRFRYKSVMDHPPFPFCSAQCKSLDLGRWLSNEYAVVEDLNQGHDLKAGGLNLNEIDDPDVKEALRELEEEHGG
jgi:endogenous inhibitor of DNA gyrase (YacG/DUF329 family)